MTIETVDAKIISIEQRESKGKHWPWIKVRARTSDCKMIYVHIYPWECRETQEIEVGNIYTLDIWKHEKETYWHLNKIRAQLV